MDIYVGNLNFKVSESDLEGLFSAYGTVGSAKIITDKYSGRSKAGRQQIGIDPSSLQSFRSRRADAADLSALIARGQRMRRIFENTRTAVTRDVCDSIHVTGRTGEMDGHDHLCPLRHTTRNRFRIDVRPLRPGIGQDRSGTDIQN